MAHVCPNRLNSNTRTKLGVKRRREGWTVGLNGWMDRWFGWMRAFGGWMDGWMDAGRQGWTDRWMVGWMDSSDKEFKTEICTRGPPKSE